uniref:RNasePH-like protein n=1 Tax=Trypanosoma congolense (strain IL3000) TaxID=1068625 RepID=G0UJ16_TRYCI|nr:RNasePH-like protein [Trypanosoma congolense IL3000]
MQPGLGISEVEIRTVHDGIANGVRSDGRSLTQRRPFTIVHNRGDVTHFEGGSVEVQCDGTIVLAAATPSVVELDVSRGGTPRGLLFVSIVAAPAVVESHAQSLRNNSGRYRQAFLSQLATTIRHTFGAEGVTAQERQQQLGIAEAEIIASENDNFNPSESADEPKTIPIRDECVADTCSRRPEDRPVSYDCGFPGEQLYVGGGYAFRVDVDVHVLQSSGGNLASIISLAVHAVLKVVRLPSVTLHEASAGFSLEVDYSKPYASPVDWSRLPILNVILISPTRHYVVDPTRLEELALPQQLHVAVNNIGQVLHMRFHQLPSRRGNAMRLVSGNTGGLSGEDDTHATENEGECHVDANGVAVGMSISDMAAMLHAAVHISQAVVAECDEILAG